MFCKLYGSSKKNLSLFLNKLVFITQKDLFCIHFTKKMTERNMKHLLEIKKWRDDGCP